MTTTDRLQLRTIITGIALMLLTALSVYTAYGADLFSKWPWMRFSIGMATLTCLWAYALSFGWIVGGSKDWFYAPGFALVIIPFNALIMYPGMSLLGIHSDPAMFRLLFICEVIHGLGFYVIEKGIERNLAGRATEESPGNRLP